MNSPTCGKWWRRSQYTTDCQCICLCNKGCIHCSITTVQYSVDSLFLLPLMSFLNIYHRNTYLHFNVLCINTQVHSIRKSPKGALFQKNTITIDVQLIHTANELGLLPVIYCLYWCCYSHLEENTKVLKLWEPLKWLNNLLFDFEVICIWARTRERNCGA